VAPSDLLPFGPLTARTAHLCLDMQNLFAEKTPWHTPWMRRVAPATRAAFSQCSAWPLS
jgi:nicotinamidase-related amidase